MKNRFTFLFIALLSLLCSNAKAQWSDISFITKGEIKGINDVNGNVKSIQEVTYAATERFGTVEKGGVLSVSEIKYNAQGKFVEKWVTLSDTTRHLSANAKYDEKGRCIESSEYNKDGSLKQRYIFLYDENGSYMDASEYDGSGKLSAKRFYRYRPLGRLAERDCYDSKGELQMTYNFKYNSAGKLSEDIGYVNGEVYSKDTYTYSNRDKSIEVAYSKGEHIKDNQYTKVEQYSSDGDKTYTNGGATILTYKYTYDKEKNWTERVGYEQLDNSYLPKPVSLTERTITYWGKGSSSNPIQGINK